VVTSISPELPLFLDDDAAVLRVRVPVLPEYELPVAKDKSPPFALAVDPAVTVISPPSPTAASPTEREIEPPAPPVEEPVANAILPELPVLSPVATLTSPLD